MNESTNMNTKRYPWLAVFLSLLMPGLGQLYCGAILKCLWLAGLISVAGLLSILGLEPIAQYYGIHLNGKVVIVFQVLALLLYGLGIIDAFITARRTREDYKLKDYNRLSAYVLLYLAVSGGYISSAIHVRDYLWQPFKVPSEAMYPAIWPGDRLLADKNAYQDHDPAIGDIVIFHDPDHRRQFFIKRVVAVGGDAVEIREGELYINDVKLKREEAPRPTVIPSQIKGDRKYFDESNRDAKYRIYLIGNGQTRVRSLPKTVVPQHHCFVVADNRDDSLDSRDFGAIPVASIVGKASFIYAPGQDWSRFGTVP